jgi:hypothetical protein
MATQVRDKAWKDVVTQLYRYCHAEGCSNLTECPQVCLCDNVPNLDLDTSIAWRTCQMFESIEIWDTQTVLKRLGMALDVLAYHSNKYNKLMHLLERAYHMVYILHNTPMPLSKDD